MGGAGDEGLREEVQSLRTMFSCTLLLLFVFSFCVNVFLYRQSSALGSQVGEAQQMVSGFRNGGAAQVIDLWTKLNDYAKTHPDYAPVIQKYSQFINIRTNGSSAAVKK
ncbi:MAG: hypothetical protein JWQ04_3492 [Pedosphaera sp.]|nr:hypothetical protein [Pedosphaera sp.]